MEAQQIAPQGAFGKGSNTTRGTRGKVRGRSLAARRRLLWTIAEMAHLFRGGAWFITLTYGKDAPSAVDSKDHFRKWCRTAKDAGYDAFGLWVLESQKRGAPHYHLLMGGVLPSTMTCLKWRWLTLTGLNGSDMEDRLKYGFDAQIYGESQYAMAVEKYLAKVFSREMAKQSQQEDAMHTGRTWGIINREYVKIRKNQIEFDEISPEAMRDWLVDRTVRAYHQSGGKMGAVTMDEEGELFKIVQSLSTHFDVIKEEMPDV